uniref:Uncharacterized protein n=1 Tax=Arundo donax TaxID=35708 RepID=A0A0A8YEE0_ARUDO
MGHQYLSESESNLTRSCRIAR